MAAGRDRSLRRGPRARSAVRIPRPLAGRLARPAAGADERGNMSDGRAPLPAAPPLDSTFDLLARARAGDPAARNQLFERYRPRLAHWAHGRLPARARDLNDTDDLVQNTLVRALSHLGSFDARHDGAFLAYLRQILRNLVRDDLRRVSRRPDRQELDEALADESPSPVDRVIGREDMDRYEAALERLSRAHREAVLLRVEFGLSYEELAQEMNRPTANAARLLVARALVRLAREMHATRR